MKQVGITEAADPAYNKDWIKWALERREPTILITKNLPKLFADYPDIINQDNILFHATVTGYGGTFLEPNAPHPRDTLLELEKVTKKDRITIRIDPIIPLKNFIERSFQVYSTATMFGFKRFRISIMDLYPHVLKRFNGYHEIQYELKQAYQWDLSHSVGEHKDYMIHAPAVLRKQIIDQFPGAEICGEPGFLCGGCISRKDLILMGITPEKRYVKSDQREFCSCLGIKKELCKTHNCPVLCVYCYWKRLEDEQN
jgi:DNA repair photolyase